MTWREILALPVALVGLAFLMGVGMLSWQIGGTWSERNTDTLIVGLVATCAGGTVVIGVVLGIIVGIPFMLRMLRESESRVGEPEIYYGPSALRRSSTIDGSWHELPGDATPLMLSAPQNQQFAPQQPTQQAQQPYIQSWQQQPGQQPSYLQPPMIGVSLDSIDDDDKFGEW